MEIKDLRIGNLVRHSKDKSINVVEFLSPFSGGFANTTILTDSYFPPFVIELAEPIPLTEEWLLKMGFKEDGGVFELENIKCFNSEFTIYINHNTEWTNIQMKEVYGNNESDCINIPMKFKYVHQLQNLYHALTGTELILK